MIVNCRQGVNVSAADSAVTMNINFDFGSSGITKITHLSRTDGVARDITLTSLGGTKYRWTVTIPGGAAKIEPTQ